MDRDVHYAGSGRVLPTDHESSRGLSNAEIEVLRYVREHGLKLPDVWRMEYRLILRGLVKRGMIEEFAFAGEGPGSEGYSYHVTQYGMNQLLQADKGMPDQAKSLAMILGQIIR